MYISSSIVIVLINFYITNEQAIFEKQIRFFLN